MAMAQVRALVEIVLQVTVHSIVRNCVNTLCHMGSIPHFCKIPCITCHAFWHRQFLCVKPVSVSFAYSQIG